MCFSDDEDDCFARFLESEVSSVEENEQTKEPETKRQRIEKDETKDIAEKEEDKSGHILNVPTEVFRRYILKFLSPEDLLSCSMVCKFLNFAASDESLWRRLYCIRWGLTPPTRKLRECSWKKIYINRDKQEMIQLVRNCPSDFKEYYIQMQAAKRTQAPLDDDGIILDKKTVLEQVSLWKESQGFTDKVVTGHICQGTLTECTYHQIDDVFICKETGYVHICDVNCIKLRDTNAGVMVCPISGLCS